MGLCIPEKHYMVDISMKIDQIIKEYIYNDYYFTMNRARQFGKTTTLRMLEHILEKEALVIRISFEGKDEYFSSLRVLAKGLCFSLKKSLEEKANCMSGQKEHLMKLSDIFRKEIDVDLPLQDLSGRISEFCKAAGVRTVLMIDEVDRAADNQTFFDFLGMLRDMYLDREDRGIPTFSNVILAGVHDIKNLKMKLRPEDKHSYNSPWNIAAKFDVDLSFSPNEIDGMLAEYEKDHQTGMNISLMAQEIYDYTSGYPYLVSRICKIMDEEIGTDYSWNRNGLQCAIRILLKESNTLFDDMRKQITEYSELKQMIYEILFHGQSFPYNPDNHAIDIGWMFGFVKERDGLVVISNRIFETRLYNMFLSEEVMKNQTYKAASQMKNQFVTDEKLNMELILGKFVEHFTSVYGETTEKFIEENGRRLFLLYLRPIINGVGNYYIEAQTRDQLRTDIIVDYCGKQYIIEMKIWHGESYNKRGEQQLSEYLDYYHLKRGYLISFSFNRNKKAGIKEIQVGNKSIMEVVV